jgi:outer membrane protein TolC
MVKRMRTFTFFLLLPFPLFGQADSVLTPEKGTQDLQSLVGEALLNNPDIRAELHQIDANAAKVPQEASLDDPVFTYFREEMPGFRLNEAMFSKYELMQMIRFPSKLSAQSKLADIEVDHARQTHLEKINEVLEKLKSGYYELWGVQQNIALQHENARLLKQFIRIANAKYAVGEAAQQEVLKAQVELAKTENALVDLRRQEHGVKAMLMAVLNRSVQDTLGPATIPEDVVFRPSLETLQRIALENRPMIVHDSLDINQSRMMLSLAKQEYLPDLRLGVMYMDSPISGMNGWSVAAGISLPFAPWTLNKASGRVEQASAMIRKSEARYTATRNMVTSEVAELYYRIEALKQQLTNYRSSIIPSARQSLDASLAAYQTGRTDFLMLLDSYRTLVDLQMEYYMQRMQFEQTVATLERAVGYQQVAYL